MPEIVKDRKSGVLQSMGSVKVKNPTIEQLHNNNNKGIFISVSVPGEPDLRPSQIPKSNRTNKALKRNYIR